MRHSIVLVFLIISSTSFSQKFFDLIQESGYFDTIPSCDATYFIESSSFFDSVYNNGEYKIIAKSASALSILEYTDSCSAFFIVYEYAKHKKTVIRLGKYNHIKMDENSSSGVLSYWVDFIIKRKKSGWLIVNYRQHLNKE